MRDSDNHDDDRVPAERHPASVQPTYYYLNPAYTYYVNSDYYCTVHIHDPDHPTFSTACVFVRALP